MLDETATTNTSSHQPQQPGYISGTIAYLISDLHTTAHLAGGQKILAPNPYAALLDFSLLAATSLGPFFRR